MSVNARSDNRIGEEATWMSQKGIDEICAAVVRCAYDDYVKSKKAIIALSGCMTGKNVEDYLAGKEKAYSRYYNGDRKIDGIMNCMENLWHESLTMQADCRNFFTGQRFQMFASTITGQNVMSHADRVVELWATDQIKSTGLYFDKKIFKPRKKRKKKSLLFSGDMV